ncbi:MAG: YihY/virulence factor BrkB family protein [Xenococcus sp. (in: cyanobacteria)]
MKWQQDECWEMGAALAYYGIFSIFPLLLVILSIVGFLLGADTNVHKQLLSLTQNTLPPATHNTVISTLRHLNQRSMGAGLVGFFLLLFTASNFFAALNRFVNKIWQIRTRHHHKKNLCVNILNFIKGKIFAFGLVLGTALVIKLSLLSRIVIDAILKILDNLEQSFNLFNVNYLLLIEKLHKGALFLLLSLAIMVLLKILPATRIAWGDVWLGALITETCFRLLQYLVRNSIIQVGSQFLSYGVVGSMMILLLWIFLTCQIFLLGCEFTYVYAHLYGSYRQRKVCNSQGK